MATPVDGILAGFADDPVVDNRLPHLKLALDSRVPPVFFLPGDPARVDLFGERAQGFRHLSSNREFIVASGSYDGFEFGVCSTGIGGGSTEIAVVELARLGVKVMVRTGGCGALRPRLACGDFVINSGAVRWGGSSLFYAPTEYPAVADPFLAVALASTCPRLKLPCHVGVVASIDSYYEGQGRQATPGREPVEGTARLELLRRLGVLNIDMETETLYTVGSVLGIRVANILVIHGNRATGDWLVNYGPAQLAMVGVALESLERLYARLG